jgi:putative flippase GtrA
MKFARRQLVQAGEYMVGGVSYFWSGYLIFALCYSGLHWNWFPAKMLADAVGWTLNYVIQRYWAFKDPALNHKEAGTITRYGAITILNFGLDYAIIWSLNRIGISPYIGFFISAAFFTVWNYVWYRFWVFYGKRSGDAKEVAHE